MVSLNEVEAKYQVPRTCVESQSVILTVSKAVGKSVVVTVWIESQPSALVNWETTTPVSAGLHEVAVAKVWSEELIVILNVVIKSQPLAAPATMVSLNEVEEVYVVPLKMNSSQTILSIVSVIAGWTVTATFRSTLPQALLAVITYVVVALGLTLISSVILELGSSHKILVAWVTVVNISIGTSFEQIEVSPWSMTIVGNGLTVIVTGVLSELLQPLSSFSA